MNIWNYTWKLRDTESKTNKKLLRKNKQYKPVGKDKERGNKGKNFGGFCQSSQKLKFKKQKLKKSILGNLRKIYSVSLDCLL